MNYNATLSRVAVMVAGAVPLAAQLPVGADAPSTEIARGFNGAPDSWDEFEGRALLVKISRTW